MSEIPDVRREFLSDLDLVNLMVRLIRIRLDNCLVWIAVDELEILPAKIIKAFLSPSDLAMRTLERI
jgi:hypothetical protein